MRATFFKIFTILILVNLSSSWAAIQLEVIKPKFKVKRVIKVIRAIPDSFETYSLTQSNGREMVLICASNRVYDNNKKAMIEYRNFYNEIAGYFIIENNSVCKSMAKFIESTHYAIDEENPFIISLNTNSMKVEKIVYPQIDPFSNTGNIKDLFPKKKVIEFSKPSIYFN
jgi:hypothetical protein